MRPASRRASASSPPRPKDERVAALQATHAQTRGNQLHEAAVDLVLRHGVVTGALAHVDERGVAARELQYRRRDQRVVHDDVGFAQQARAAQRDELGFARTGADQPGDARLSLGLPFGEATRHGAVGVVVATGQHVLGDDAAEHVQPEALARLARGNRFFDRVAPARGQRHEAIRAGRQGALDDGLGPARDRRGTPAAGDGHG